MVLILIFAMITQVVIQYYCDHRLLDSIFGKYGAAKIRYYMGGSLTLRFIWNAITSGILGLMIGTISGLYGPIAIIGGFILYEIFGEVYAHDKWVRDYVMIHNNREIDRFVAKQTRKLKREAKAAGYVLTPEEVEKAIQEKYKDELKELRIKARARLAECTTWMHAWIHNTNRVEVERPDFAANLRYHRRIFPKFVDFSIKETIKKTLNERT